MKLHKKTKHRIPQELIKPSNNPYEGWIIFFDDATNRRHYVSRVWKGIGRIKFETNRFKFYRNILDCHSDIVYVEDMIKSHPEIVSFAPLQGKVKLLAAQATVPDFSCCTFPTNHSRHK